MVGALVMTVHMKHVGQIVCLAQEGMKMPRELHWTISDHDEMDEVKTPCGWCQDPDGDDCRCYFDQDEEEYER